MLRPAKMVKLTIVAPKRGLRPIVEKLYDLRSVHLVEFSEGRDPAFEGFRLGKPLPEGQGAAERLVRLRALGRHLELSDHEPATRHAVRDIEARLDEHIHQLELNINSAAESKARIQASIETLEKERAQLGPLQGLPLRLEDYTGYQSLAVFLGRAEHSVEPALSGAVPDSEVFAAPTGHFAVFVPKAKASKAAEAIARAGGQLTEAPRGSGTPQERLDGIGRELQQLQARLSAATEDLARLRRQHADFLVAAEEHLSIQAEKAEAPLGFASTENAFVAECWAPEEEVERVRASLREAVGDRFHIEIEVPEALAHAAAHGEGEAPGEGASLPPTKFDHARAFRPFRMFTEMVSVPRYDEIDPTPVLALVLPLFLGFMIGDAGYGFLMLALGVLFVRRFGRKMEEARDIGIALAAAGVLSLVFGAVVFSDAFGIPLGMHELPEGAAAGQACAEFIHHHRETTWGCILGQELVIHPVIAKLRDISDLLVLSVLAAFVHMALGLGFGMANAWNHSKKHVVAKLGWLVLMVGFFAQILYMARGNDIAGAVFRGLALPTATLPILGVEFHLFLLGGMVLAAVLLAVSEGPITVLELPTMLSNLMSYTRLAGLAIAKGAMAAAFTSLTLVAMVYGGPGGAVGLVLAIVGLVLFVLTQAFVFVLGVFSSSIQAIRLNYVEFFNKFYQGGGIPFRPFGKPRKYTQEAS